MHVRPFSPAASPSPWSSSLQSLSQLGWATPILKMTLKMTNLPTKQETEENNFLVGSQNILNSLREQ